MPDSAPVGQLIDTFYRVREARNELMAEVKEYNRKLEVLKQAIIEKLNDQNLEGGRGHEATGSISEKVVGSLKDYEAFSRFVYRHKKIHLLEKRISVPSFREELALRGEVPGVEPFTKIDLNVQKRSK